MTWKLSQFTVVRGLGERGLPEHVLVFNTLTGRCASTSRAEWERLSAALDGRGDPPPELARSVAGLVGAGIAVPADLDERAAYLASFEAARRSPPRIFPILAVTTACNLGCTYCYEAGVTGRTMSMEVVAGVLRWFERRVAGDGIREIYPALFGGEPLLYPRLLFTLMDGLREICERHGARCGFSSSSNGALLTGDLARELASRGLSQIQISLDGPREIHDARRMGKRNEPSYDDALRGIRLALAHIRNVTVKVNFDRHNRPFIPALFDTLAAEGLAGAVDVKLEAVAVQLPGSHVAYDERQVIPPESAELADAYLELTLEVSRRGFTVRPDTAHTTPCMFSSHHGVIIGPDGDIYKCISLVGRRDLRVGTVLDDDYDRAAYARQMDVAGRLADCFTERCPYVPVCAGGCAYESIARGRSYEERFCAREHLEGYHYMRYLIRRRASLEAMGMRPLSPDELRGPEAAAWSPPERLIQLRRPGRAAAPPRDAT